MRCDLRLHDIRQPSFCMSDVNNRVSTVIDDGFFPDADSLCTMNDTRASLWSKWLRWTVVVTEPLLAPIRRVLPPMGMFDLSPMVLTFGLVILAQLIAGS